MLYAKASPYVNRFNEILRRLSESGYIKLWLDNAEEFIARGIRSYKEGI